MERLIIPYPIIVEGKYDKIKLASILDAEIFTTGGFEIFKQNEKLALFRALAKKSPVIVLTDSDGAGKLIRSRLTGAIPKDRLVQLYIPRVEGKERRKDAPSAEGTLGVEGMDAALLREIFAPYARKANEIKDSTASRVARAAENPLSKTDFYLDGLTGADGSREKRAALCRSLGLPPDMTAGALLSALKLLLSYEEYLALVGREVRGAEGTVQS